MPAPSDPEPERRVGLRSLIVYVIAWLCAGAALAFVVVAVLSGGEDDVTLPPVQETRLSSATRSAGCVLRLGAQASEPPVSGPRAEPAPARVYDDPPPEATLIGALRRGIIVIHYRPDLPDDRVEQLRTIQSAVPRGTIVTPNARMRPVLAVTAWRRLLGCRAFSDRTIDAIRLFRGRYIGSGPEADDASP